MFMTHGTTATWTNEAGFLEGFCVGCGDRVTTHPDDCAGGLAYCGDCSAITCSACRSDDSAGRCPVCQAAFTRQNNLSLALGLVLDRMGCYPETLDQAIEAVQDDFGGRAFGDVLRTYAQGKR